MAGKKKKGGRVTNSKVDWTWTIREDIKDRYDYSYIHPAHVCQPNKAMGLKSSCKATTASHYVLDRTEWTCSCGKHWTKVTRDTKICGCGWELDE